MALIVLIHGLGASGESWGSTLGAVRERLDEHTIELWNYETSRMPDAPAFQRALEIVRGWKHQSIPELGQHLWSDLQTWCDGHDKVILVGHSLGGLVGAAAVTHGFASGDDHGDSLRAKLQGMVCIATPFAGCSFLKPFAGPSKNRHIVVLSPKSRIRRHILIGLMHILDRGELSLVLMRAAEDAYVLSGEVTNPFSPSQYLELVLSGKHTECISHLQIEDDNLVKIVAAIEGMLGADTVSSEGDFELFPDRSTTIRSRHHDKLSRLEDNLDILAWGLAAFREDYGSELPKWAGRGSKIRILLVNPTSAQGEMLCDSQDKLEGRRSGSTARDIETFLTELQPFEGYEVRVSDFHPGFNIFRIDNEVFFGLYLADRASANAPSGMASNTHWLFETLMSHFNSMWERAYAPSLSSSSDSE